MFGEIKAKQEMSHVSQKTRGVGHPETMRQLQK